MTYIIYKVAEGEETHENWKNVTPNSIQWRVVNSLKKPEWEKDCTSNECEEHIAEYISDNYGNGHFVVVEIWRGSRKKIFDGNVYGSFAVV